MSYLPNTDSGLRDWAKNFSDKAAALLDPTAVGLTAAQVIEYAAAYADYDIKYIAAVEPNTRGGATILAKNQSKEALIVLSRELAMYVANASGTTDLQRYEFGLTIPDTEPTPTPVPTTPPNLSIQLVTGRVVTIRLRDAENPDSRGKPEGVIGAAVLSYVGEAIPSDLGDWKFEGNTTRAVNVNVAFPPSVAAGSQVWITAFWFNTRGESGLAASPVTTNVSDGLVQAA